MRMIISSALLLALSACGSAEQTGWGCQVTNKNERACIKHCGEKYASTPEKVKQCVKGVREKAAKQ